MSTHSVRRTQKAAANSGLMTLCLVLGLIAVLAVIVLTVAVPAVNTLIGETCSNLPDVLKNAANICH